MAIKKELLDDFVGEEVLIITDIKTVASTADGEMVEVPLVLEGLFVDYDATFLLISYDQHSSPELIRKECVLSVKLAEPPENLFLKEVERKGPLN
jgi:hypothetical protein